eukprot:TRINITY_DN20043_c0_g1_i1.p1 TRINITY_DN20043_c0_g1~~TRINITY_DN20043_c0_g1_i1.p1  ORF type:complete len:262 (-),score=43.27 TRINITY_DN20043_c0_g1_i1:346-1131(-)
MALSNEEAQLLEKPTHPKASCGETESTSHIVLSQDMSCIEEALSTEVWEFDGDSANLFVDEAKADGTPGGCVIETFGGRATHAELVHAFRAGQGAKIEHLKATFLVEAMDADTSAGFTVALAFDDDLEEDVLLAATVGFPCENPGDNIDAGFSDVPTSRRSPNLHLNGRCVREDAGSFPLRVMLDAVLKWDEGARRIRLGYSFADVVDGEEQASAEADFYTAGSFDHARALCLRATGQLRVRVVHVSCSEAAPVPEATAVA